MINYNIKRSLKFVIIAIFGCFSLLNGQDEATLNIGCMDGEVGDQFCIDITVEDFVGIESVEGSISFNSTIMEFVSADVTGSCVSTLSGSDIVDVFAEFGFLNIVWYQGPATCNDGEVFLTLCFRFIGDPGACTSVVFDDTGIDFAIGGPDGSYVPEVNTCDNCIITNDLTIVSGYCEASPGGADGSIRFYPIGGQGPYNCRVFGASGDVFSGQLDGGEEAFVDNLPQGFYTIEIIDANGQTRSIVISITENFPIDFNLTGLDPTCFDRDDGEITIDNINGGQGPYDIAWSNNQFNLPTIDDLGTGTYFVTVTDMTGCEETRSLDLFVDTVKANVEVLDPFFCKGASDARVRLFGTGGTPQNGDEYLFYVNGRRYSYRSEWILDQDLLETNTLYVIDNRSPDCASDEITFTIPVLNEMTINQELIQDVACKGGSDGRIRVKAEVDSETNYIFIAESLPGENIVPNGTSSPDCYFNNDLPAGDYRIAVESISKMCKDTLFFSITEPDEELVLNESQILPTCAGNDGRVEVNPTGGVPNYSFDWGIPGEMDNFIGNLNGGDFKVVVTDENGCMDSVEFSLPMGGELVLEPTILQSISCAGDSNGSVIVNVSPPDNYSFVWTNANGDILGNDQTVENISQGWYYVEVSSSDCTAMDSVFVSDPSPILFEDVVLTPPDCPGQNGSIGVVMSGGFPNYSYVWTESGETNVIGIQSVLAPIQPGEYTVVVSDLANCSVDTTVTLDSPDKIDVQVSAIAGVGCSGDPTGTATATGSGGSQGATSFTYLWSNGEVSQTAIMLPAGPGWVIASDTKCSSDTIKFTIPDATPVGSLEQIFPPSCAEDCDASITILPNGGTMTGFSVNWPALNITNTTIKDLCPDTYEYIVTDSDGCSYEGSVIVTPPDMLFLLIDSTLTKNVSCKTNTGQIATTALGGNGNYEFDWTNNVSDLAIGEDLPAGSYTVTVTDEKGCTAEASYVLSPVIPVTATIPQPDEPNCFGELTCITVTQAGGGVGGPYSFQVNSGPRFPLDSCIAVFAGEYRVNVFDEAGCNLDTTITITQPSQVDVEIGDDLEVNIGEPSDVIIADIQMDLPMDSMSWQTVDPYECTAIDNCDEIIVTPIQDQTVSVFVQDINGCSATDELQIIVSDVRQVYFPNAFSPDDDGINDRFQVAIGPGVQIVNSFMVYDRYGNKMFEQSNYIPDPALNDGWNGEFNGRQAQPGVYVYYLQATFLDGKVLNYAGDLTLIR